MVNSKVLIKGKFSTKFGCSRKKVITIFKRLKCSTDLPQKIVADTEREIWVCNYN